MIKTTDNAGKGIKGIFILLILVIVFGVVKREYGLRKYKRYTIGVTTQKRKASKGVTAIYYEYRFNNLKYEGYDEYVQGVRYPNGRYYIWISSDDPEQSEFVPIEVPDSIKVAPPQGWLEIPK